jgi:hypothetical protein
MMKLETPQYWGSFRLNFNNFNNRNMIFQKINEISYAVCFHYFAYKKYETTTTAPESEMISAFLKSPFFTYSNNHREHCCGPFDNSKVDLTHFRQIPVDDIYKSSKKFLDTYQFFLDFMPNSTPKAREEDKFAINDLFYKSKEIIEAHFPQSSLLYTLGYFKKYKDDQIRVEANEGLTRASLNDYAPVFEYYKIFISAKDNFVEVYYFLWD